MPEVPVNYLAVLVAAVVMMVIGMMWHGPLFGKTWAKLSGVSEEKMRSGGMARRIGISFIGWLLMSYVLQHAIVFAGKYLGLSGIQAGLIVGFFNWLGFIAPVLMAPVLWEGKSWKLWLINSGYFLVSLLVMGIILAVWK